MLLAINKKATGEEIKKMTEDFDGYIKVVVDIKRRVLAGGGKRHFEGEQKLLGEGSSQLDLWGGRSRFSDKGNRLQFNNKFAYPTG